MGFKHFYLSEEQLHVDVNYISKDRYEKAMRYLNKKGYDLRNAQEVKNLYTRMNSSGGVNSASFPDHYKCAQQFLVPKEKKTRSPEQNIIQKVSTKYGGTHDFREAGYIMPSGLLLDMSGKSEGQMPGMRSYDHREIGYAFEDDDSDHPAKNGGTTGMLAFMELGPIRMDFASGSIHIFKEPTSAQYTKLKQFISMTPENNVISLDIEGKSSDRFEPFQRRKIIGYIRSAFSQ